MVTIIVVVIKIIITNLSMEDFIIVIRNLVTAIEIVKKEVIIGLITRLAKGGIKYLLQFQLEGLW